MGIIAPIKIDGPALTPRPSLNGFQFLAPWEFRCGAHTFTVPAGYVYDGASIPFLWYAMFSKFDPRVMAGAGAHDWLCDTTPMEPNNLEAAAMFQRMIERDGIGGFKGELAYQAVSRFGPQWGKK